MNITNITPIAYFSSPFKTKFGIPRQAGLVPELQGRIIFEPEFRNADAVRGLEEFDYLWLIWGFSCNRSNPKAGNHSFDCKAQMPADKTRFQPTVRPPRLGGNTRIGVFASRSPFRPNELGLSSVRLQSVTFDEKGPDGKPLGPVIHVLGADLMDGTPIYDIKPYIEYTDSHPGVRSGFVDSHEWKPLKVIVPEEVVKTELDWKALSEVLSQDPRPHYQDDPDKIYGMFFNDWEIKFKVAGTILTVLSAEKIQLSPYRK